MHHYRSKDTATQRFHTKVLPPLNQVVRTDTRLCTLTVVILVSVMEANAGTCRPREDNGDQKCRSPTSPTQCIVCGVRGTVIVHLMVDKRTVGPFCGNFIRRSWCSDIM